MTEEEFINRANIAHNYKYDYSLTKYTRMIDKILVICPIHGKFEIAPYQHIKNWDKRTDNYKACGCGLCGKEFTIQRNVKGKISTEEYVSRFKTIHGDKYDYSKVIYTSHKEKVLIICNIHGSFKQLVTNHLRGSCCPRCKNSKGHNLIVQWLKNHNIEFKTEHSFIDCINPLTNRKLKFDVYIQKHSIVIEYDGEQHFKPVKFHQRMSQEQTQNMLELTQYRDNIKNVYCLNNNIKILRIAYYDKDNIHNILDSIFNKQ